MDLVYKNEKRLFPILAVIATVFWLALIVVTFGVALLYLLLAFIAYLFVQSSFISYVRGNGVKVSADQFSELDASLRRCCQEVGQHEVPDMYLLRTDFFNALATKFLGRNFIVLFTDVVDALDEQPGAIDFYIAHELGHIDRGHLKWGAYLSPAMVLPVIGAAYRRAQEYTCDRYGAACCQSEADLQAALAAISAGDSRWKTLNRGAYLDQIFDTTDFWMSFHELTGDYPWLTKRMAAALAFRKGESPEFPRRSAPAWLLSLFIPRFGLAGGGGASLILSVAMIGVLAAISIPAYQDYTIRAQVSGALADAQYLQAEVESYVQRESVWPTSLADIGVSPDPLPVANRQFVESIAIYDDGLIGIEMIIPPGTQPVYVLLEPWIESGYVGWVCLGEGVQDKHLPAACRH